MDEFEEEYNFRYEEDNADKIKTYDRNVESVRSKVNERRKRQREAKKGRDKDLRRRMHEQAKMDQKCLEEDILDRLLDLEKDGRLKCSVVSDSEWWYCDHCQKILYPREEKYDRLDGQDYTLCSACYQASKKKSKFQQTIIPDGANPPAQA